MCWRSYLYIHIGHDHLLLSCPGQTLQHRPGLSTGLGQLGFGHSSLMFLHRTRPTMRRFLWICKQRSTAAVRLPLVDGKSDNNILDEFSSGASQSPATSMTSSSSRTEDEMQPRPDNEKPPISRDGLYARCKPIDGHKLDACI